MKYINSLWSRNCNPHFFTSVWELWPLGHSHTCSGIIQALSSLKCVIISYEVQNLHGRDWASPYPGINCVVVRVHAWKNGKCHFWRQQVARMLLSKGVWGTVGCWAEREVPGKQYCQKVETAAAEFGRFPDEMENDRVVCRSWIGASEVGARWDLGL